MGISTERLSHNLCGMRLYQSIGDRQCTCCRSATTSFRDAQTPLVHIQDCRLLYVRQAKVQLVFIRDQLLLPAIGGVGRHRITSGNAPILPNVESVVLGTLTENVQFTPREQGLFLSWGSFPAACAGYISNYVWTREYSTIATTV